MNYREFDPNASCLPAEAYPYLWAALSTPSQPQPTLWSRCRAALARLCAALPLLMATACLPEPDLSPPPDSKIHSLVWVQPLPGKTLPAPPTLPRLDGNPYRF
jgi:hypothetical protein